MKNRVSKLKCLFGHHKYTIPYSDIVISMALVCEWCKKSGICICHVCKAGVAAIYDLDDDGKFIFHNMANDD